MAIGVYARRRVALARTSVGVATFLTITGTAVAQTAPSLEADNLVLSRPRPGLDAEGLPLGGFRVFPSLGASVAYDDNIYDTTAGKVSSPVFELDPEVNIRSNWSRHAFNLDAQGTIQRYSQRSSENNEDYKITGAGRIDLASVSHIDLEGHALQAIEQRGTPGDVFTAGDPVQFHDVGGSAGAATSLGRLQLTVNGNIDRFTYGLVKVDNVEQSQKYRDRVHYSATGGVAYNLSPALQPFVSITYEKARYDLRDRTTSLDSSGTTVLGGVNISLTKLITGRVGLGYRWRDYRNPLYKSTNGLTYDIAIVWNPRTLVSVTLEAIKAVDDSPSQNSSGIVRNQGSATVDYELMRNIILQVSGTEVSEKYRGTGFDDNRFVASFGARYLVNRFAEVGLHYDHTRQTGTSLFRGPYTANYMRLSLTLQR